MTLASFKHFAWVGCLAAAATLTPSSQAASITAQLDCNINVLNDTGSCGGTSFGEVTIDNSAGDGTVLLTVDLFNSDLKFKDMLLAFAGAATSISDNDPNNIISLDPNGFPGIGPGSVLGDFDIGDDETTQGWNGDSPYSVILTGNVALTLEDFLNAFDTNGEVSVVMHIQGIGPGGCNTPSTCTPGTAGSGSLFQGGSFTRDPGGDVPEIPEPSTMLLLGGALLGLGLIRNKRNS